MNDISDSVIHLDTDFEIVSSHSPNETGMSVDMTHLLCSLDQTRRRTKGRGLHQKGYQARQVPSDSNPQSNGSYLKVLAVPGLEALNRAGLQQKQVTLVQCLLLNGCEISLQGCNPQGTTLYAAMLNGARSCGSTHKYTSQQFLIWGRSNF